jgi:hypothetical protein
MNCLENLYVSLYQHQNILINEQNTYETNPSANQCMNFHTRTRIRVTRDPTTGPRTNTVTDGVYSSPP